MIYTIISKLPFITSDKSNRRFFKIFVFGSLLYILLHYYLYQKDQEGILDNLKTYIYYALAIDLCLAYALDKWSNLDTEKVDDTELPNNKKQIEQNNDSQKKITSNNNTSTTQQKFTPEQQAEYDRRYIEWKKQQEYLKTKNDEQPTKKQETSEKEEDNVEFENEEEPSLPKLKNKTKIIEKSEISTNSKKSKSESREHIGEDTDLPRFRK